MKLEKFNITGLSKKEAKLVKEAASLSSPVDAEKRGWDYIDMGAYKLTYRKQDIVVKFARRPAEEQGEDHITGEGKFYFSLPKRDRKFFARIYGYSEEKIIQRYVSSGTSYYDLDVDLKEKIDDQLKYLQKEYRLSDVFPGSNSRILNKKLVAFDFARNHYNNPYA